MGSVSLTYAIDVYKSVAATIFHVTKFEE